MLLANYWVSDCSLILPRISGHSPLKTIGGGTYAREFENGVAFGVLFPGEVEMAHETDEFISIDSLMKAGVIITDAIYSVCNIMK